MMKRETRAEKHDHTEWCRVKHPTAARVECELPKGHAGDHRGQQVGTATEFTWRDAPESGR
jgi:hypothetical protein